MSDAKLYACETCVRGRLLAPGEASRGQLLVSAIDAVLAALPALPFAFRVVSCLSGCLSPCNIALRGRGKYSLRFSRLGPCDAPAIVEFAQRYAVSRDGDVPPEHWPAAWRAKLTSRVAPYAGSAYAPSVKPPFS